ncbi:MAG: hypothetical protein OHK0053_27110 [Microscillaceae bacterium]
MKKLSSLLLLLLGLFVFVSCGDDDENPVIAEPTIGQPATNTTSSGATATFTVAVTAPGGLKTITATATAGSVTVGTFTIGATSANVDLNYTAPSVTSDQTVVITVTVTDNANQTEDEAIIINVTVKPIKEVFAANDGLKSQLAPSSANTYTMYSDTVYVLRGFVFVNGNKDGANNNTTPQTLIIQPGTVIKGQPGAGSGASALIVARGGKIEANGTANAPIIMTALSDDLDRTDDLPFGLDSQWGSLLVLGSARINGTADVVGGESAVEGIPTTEPRGLYGGTNDADNSGTLRYISLRHGGAEIGASNEINGLSMGAVGNGTTIEYIEVFSNFDDGYEWFGGTVNAKYLIAAYAGDDAIDWDQGFTGKVQYLLVAQEPAATASPKGGRGCECNGVVNGATIDYNSTPISNPIIANATFIGAGAGASEGQVFEFRQGSAGRVYNSIFFNFSSGVRVNGVSATEAVESETRLDAGQLLFVNNIFGQVNSGTTLANVAVATSATDNAALKTKIESMLANNGNIYNNTIGLVNPVVAAGFDPGLVAGGAADGVTPFNLNATDTFFDNVTKIGAFPTANNWAAGWTAISAYGILAD